MSDGAQPRDKREVPQMHQRSIHHDYHDRGIYLITLCTEGRRPLLGHLIGSTPGEAAIQPTALGQEVLRCWESIPSIQQQLAREKAEKTGQPCTRDITLLSSQLMPDHFHGILFVRQKMDIALGDIIRGFMVGCTQALHGKSPQICRALNQDHLGGERQGEREGKSPQICRAPNQDHQGTRLETGITPDKASRQAVGCSANSRGQDVEGSPGGRDSGLPSPLPPLWEKGFHDRLLMHEGQLQNMIDYVHDNPRRLMLRRLHPELLVVQRNVHFVHWAFSAIGQPNLLDNTLTAVHVRRYFSYEQRRNYMNSCILAARHGSVLVSPFISEYEKRVRDEALREGLYCIQLCPEPFSDYHRPPGELIDACYNGHLLLLSMAPATASPNRRITRDDCSSLNAVAESMARESPANDVPNGETHA